MNKYKKPPTEQIEGVGDDDYKTTCGGKNK